MLLTEQEIKDLLIPLFIRQDQASIHWPDIFEEVALIEAAVIEKIKAQGPVAWRFDISEDSYNQKWGLTESGGLAKSGDPRAQPLYRLPEGEGNATD